MHGLLPFPAVAPAPKPELAPMPIRESRKRKHVGRETTNKSAAYRRQKGLPENYREILPQESESEKLGKRWAEQLPNEGAWLFKTLLEDARKWAEAAGIRKKPTHIAVSRWLHQAGCRRYIVGQFKSVVYVKLLNQRKNNGRKAKDTTNAIAH